jgi:hypothetical protein
MFFFLVLLKRKEKAGLQMDNNPGMRGTRRDKSGPYDGYDASNPVVLGLCEYLLILVLYNIISMLRTS